MSFLAGLNEAQSRAVDHHEGPLLVVAGAGAARPGHSPTGLLT